MPKITFQPVNMTCEAEEGESILDIALNHDVPLQHACGGFCACTTCHVIVKSGEENLSEMEDEEKERMEEAGGFPPHSRLSCQTRVEKGEVVVEMMNSD